MGENSQTQKKHTNIQYVTITPDQAGQRLDNFLTTRLKGLPKSRLYRLIRKGEVRVNKKRTTVSHRLLPGDSIRLPPMFLNKEAKKVPPSAQTEKVLSDRILYEDENILILNKPFGMSVHAGSTVRVGVIEALRHMFPKLKHLELAHRLDSETSGCLILAKKRRVLRELHEILREGKMLKIYWALTKGQWQKADLKVNQPLHKDYRDGGKHVVEVSKDGKHALTHFKPLKEYAQASLMEVKLFTGRTHQIRVHAEYKGHPIAGDDRYGDADFNKAMRKKGLKRMFLHAHTVEFTLPSADQKIKVSAPLDGELEGCLKKLS